MRSPWLPESAMECTPSAIIEAEPVKANATSLATAMPRLAASAAAIALDPPSALTAGPPSASGGSRDPHFELLKGRDGSRVRADRQGEVDAGVVGVGDQAGEAFEGVLALGGQLA